MKRKKVVVLYLLDERISSTNNFMNEKMIEDPCFAISKLKICPENFHMRRGEYENYLFQITRKKDEAK